MPLLYLSIAWIAGIFIGSKISLPLWFSAIALLLVFIASFFLRNRRRALITAGLCLLIIAVGAWRYQVSIQSLDSSQLQFYNDKSIARITGVISGPPEIQHSSETFRFSTSKIEVNGTVHEIKGDALVRLPFYKEFHYGDVLQLYGKLETPQQFDDFDYRNYLANQGIYSILNYPGVMLLETGSGFQPLSWIYNVRDKLAESLSLCLPEPQSSLAQAILLGLRGNLPRTLVQAFYATGTTHLIAISGLNLTIIMGMVIYLAIWRFGRRNRLYIWISLAFIWLYTALTGMPATVVRAAIMGSVFLLAELLGRQRNGAAALSLAAALMVAVEPRVLWDISFQLSFLSMLGLILISPYLIRYSSHGESTSNKYIIWLKKTTVISFGTTLAAILATWPITAINFHSFSLASMPATFFAMPSFPAIIFTSMLTSTAGLVWQPLGQLFGWVNWLFLSYFLLVIQLFSAIPAAYIQGISLQFWQAIIYYTAFSAMLICLKNWQPILSTTKALLDKAAKAFSSIKNGLLKPYIYWIIALLLIANILVWTCLAMMPDGKLHVTILDVGQGESILVRTPDGHNILIDTGPDPIATCAQIGKQLPFWDRQIEMLILTQLQSDHISGAVQLLYRYNVKTMALPPIVPDSSLSREILDCASNKSVKLISLHDGQQLYLGQNLGLAVLNPPKILYHGTADDANNNSLVLHLSYKNVSFLLTSDIGMDAERYLTGNRADLHSDVLKVAHHGSNGSTSAEFIKIVDPVTAVISAGAENRFGHPAKEVLNRLSTQVQNESIFTTATNGAVEFTTDGSKLWCRIEKRLK